MTNPEQKQKAEAFRSLHSGSEVLLLPNAWEVGSARIVEECGFPAIATTSAGIAFSHGYADGQNIPKEDMFAAVARIARAVKVPVTADIESGYGNRPEDAAQTARAVIEAGAVGMNLEDATGDSDRPLAELSLQLEKIHAVRETTVSLNLPLVLNARTDVYLLQVGDPSKRYEETVRRLQAFRDAGADCVFVPGLRDASTIGRLVADLRCAVNILAVPGSPSVADLAKLGVVRVSLGSGPMRATLGFFRRLAKELKTAGTYTAMDGAPSYAEMNELMNSSRRRKPEN
ncbi:MAG: isocitrate lyase/phosphoenolpyruvate mutase family protein [Candidatus Sulfotelmatobacter sp.]|jgi:2-methylisocitrate lyase-like PEP mutase family enzyme